MCTLGHTPSARSRAQAGAAGRDRPLRGAVAQGLFSALACLYSAAVRFRPHAGGRA
jgi:hypothetical protein